MTLRNVSETSVSTNKLQPYKDVMLILIKGRRHVQARLVEPVVDNINSGDNYILVTKSEVLIMIIASKQQSSDTERSLVLYLVAYRE